MVGTLQSVQRRLRFSAASFAAISILVVLPPTTFAILSYLCWRKGATMSYEPFCVPSPALYRSQTLIWNLQAFSYTVQHCLPLTSNRRRISNWKERKIDDDIRGFRSLAWDS